MRVSKKRALRAGSTAPEGSRLETHYADNQIIAHKTNHYKALGAVLRRKTMEDNIFEGFQKQDAFIHIDFYQKDKKNGPSPQVGMRGTMEHAMRGAAGILYSIHLQAKIPIEVLVSFLGKELALMAVPGNTASVDLSALRNLGGKQDG